MQCAYNVACLSVFLAAFHINEMNFLDGGGDISLTFLEDHGLDSLLTFLDFFSALQTVLWS